MKIGLFGGSFDPIHRGHIEPVKEARRLLGLEWVIYLPTAVPPHKPGRRLAPPLARYAMVELALLHEPALEVCAYELTLDRPAYTAETLEHFQRQLPAAELHLLIGGDSFFELPHWVRWRDVVGTARLVVLSRPGWDLAALRREAREPRQAPAAASVTAPGAASTADQGAASAAASRAGSAAASGSALAAAPAAGPPAASPPAPAAEPRSEPAESDRQELAALLASGRVLALDQAPSGVSSTRLREILARGERPPAGWMPDLVVDFVHKYRLYR
jgi:nicotinate (nicotinamide) nucleotide adenylyltransferase